MPSIRDPETPVRPGAHRPASSSATSTFGYPGAEQPVLRGISFTARAGQTTAIVGSTGTGKSTLVNLIPRFYDATGGAVLIDGVDVREMDRQDLWRRIGFVPQQAFLFSGTVASNLRFGDADATDDELWRALEIAQARDFVEEMAGSSTRRSPRAARTSRAGSGSGWRSPARSWQAAGSTCSTTPSPPWTSARTRGCAPRCAASSATPP